MQYAIYWRNIRNLSPPRRPASQHKVNNSRRERDNTATRRRVVDLVELLRPLHAYQAAELILAELSEVGGEEALFPGYTITRKAKLLGQVLHAWAMLTQEQADRELDELCNIVCRRFVS